jgi:hypothetical protein
VAEGDRSKGRLYAALAVGGVVLVGLGVGIGALIWSGNSSTETAAPTAPASAAPASGKSPGKNYGNYNVSAAIEVSGVGEGGATMTLSQGGDSNCTKDETYGDFPVTNGSVKGISMRVKSDFDEGSCFFEKSWNQWKVVLPGGGGELGLFEQNTGGAEDIKWYEAQCQPHWTGGWSCRDDSDYGRAGFHKFWLTKTS